MEEARTAYYLQGKARIHQDRLEARSALRCACLQPQSWGDRHGETVSAKTYHIQKSERLQGGIWQV